MELTISFPYNQGASELKRVYVRGEIILRVVGARVKETMGTISTIADYESEGHTDHRVAFIT